MVTESFRLRPPFFYTRAVLGIKKVTVNEQNPNAIGFYEHMGFRGYLRTDHDTEGRPFPLIYMRYDR